jgi:hypothetical protein
MGSPEEKLPPFSSVSLTLFPEKETECWERRAGVVRASESRRGRAVEAPMA